MAVTAVPATSTKADPTHAVPPAGLDVRGGACRLECPGPRNRFPPPPSPHRRASFRPDTSVFLRMSAMVGIEPATLAEAIEEFVGKGFVARFSIVGRRLRVIDTNETLDPGDLVIRGYRRFEGASDPDDMSIVYAVESANGWHGTIVDAFGVYSEPSIGAVLEHVPFR